MILALSFPKYRMERSPLVVDREGVVCVLDALAKSEILEAVTEYGDLIDKHIEWLEGQPEGSHCIPNAKELDPAPHRVMASDESLCSLVSLSTITRLIDLVSPRDQFRA